MTKTSLTPLQRWMDTITRRKPCLHSRITTGNPSLHPLHEQADFLDQDDLCEDFVKSFVHQAECAFCRKLKIWLEILEQAEIDKNKK